MGTPVWCQTSIAEAVHRSPNITAFHLRPPLGDYNSFVESLCTRIPSDHSRFHTCLPPPPPTQPPASASPSPKPNPPLSTRRASSRTRPRGSCSSSTPANQAKTLPIYSLPSRSQGDFDGDGPRLTMPSAYGAHGLLALPVTSTPLFVAHNDPLLELAAKSPSQPQARPPPPTNFQPCITYSSATFGHRMR